MPENEAGYSYRAGQWFPPHPATIQSAGFSPVYSFQFILFRFQPFHMTFNLPLIAVVRWLIKDHPRQTVRQILLLYIVLWIIVGIAVASSMSQLLCPFVVLILQMDRNRHGSGFLHVLLSLADGHAGRVALGRGCHIGH